MPRIEPEQLALFDIGPSISKFREVAKAMKEATRAKKTLVCYQSAWRQFTEWCASTNRKALPCDSETLSLYVAARLDAGLRVTTVELAVAAIAFHHRKAGKPIPPREDARMILMGARRVRKEAPRQRLPLLPEDLRKVCAKLLEVGDARAIRDRAILLIGFATSLRRSNIAALNYSDIRFVPKKGVAVTVRSSKTDQTGLGVVKGVRQGEHADTCPVRALRDWIALRGTQEGPLFVSCARTSTGAVIKTKRRINGTTINTVVKEAIELVGLNSQAFGGHSLRAGFATTAHNEGSDVLSIMRQTGHKSVAMVERYVRNADPFAGPNPLGKAI